MIQVRLKSRTTHYDRVARARIARRNVTDRNFVASIGLTIADLDQRTSRAAIIKVHFVALDVVAEVSFFIVDPHIEG